MCDQAWLCHEVLKYLLRFVKFYFTILRKLTARNRTNRRNNDKDVWMFVNLSRKKF